MLIIISSKLFLVNQIKKYKGVCLYSLYANAASYFPWEAFFASLLVKLQL